MVDFLRYSFENMFTAWYFFIFDLLIICGVGILVCLILARPIRRLRKIYEEECRCSVVQKSAWYHQVMVLNEETKYYTEILHDGHTEYNERVNSFTKFNKTTPQMALCNYLSTCEENVLRALEQVRRNRVIYEVYDKKFQALSSTATEDLAKEINMSLSKFQAYEKSAVEELKLDIIQDYYVTCVVSYTSPAGRNRYWNDKCFGESDILEALRMLKKQAVYEQSEEHRRKIERSKVTPSLRYKIMQRDGFRCCLCGRSAAGGVELEVDHIIPVSRGGNSDEKNLQTLCRDCNRGKGASM